MSQPDEAPSIQEFFQHIRNQCKYPEIVPESHGKRVELNLIPPIKAYFRGYKYDRLNAILVALFKPEEPPDLAEAIVQDYTAVFTILLHISRGRFIEHFAARRQLADNHLPFSPSAKPYYFPDAADESFFQLFCRYQWRFSCPKFRRKNLNKQRFEQEEVLPIAKKELLGQGGSAQIYKIRLYEEYDELQTDNEKKDSNQQYTNTYVLKTYTAKDAEKNYQNEVAAFAMLRNSRQIVKCHGSYKHGATNNIILEYADKGDFERYLCSMDPPCKAIDILGLWRALFDLVESLLSIHAVKGQEAPEAAPVFQGLHQDIKPGNILVFSNGETASYPWTFKLGDLGLSQFERIVSLKKRAAIDAQGTRTYGAPECYRADEVLAAARLPVTPAADIWSLGCIYSEVARWIVTRSSGLEAYRRARLFETQSIRGFQDGDCFHDGQDMLEAVRESHQITISGLHEEDHITKRIVEDLVCDMLQSDPDVRPTAKQLWLKGRKIIDDVGMDLSISGTRSSGKTTVGSMIDGGHARPPPPPVLPPGFPPSSPTSVSIDEQASRQLLTRDLCAIPLSRVQSLPSTISKLQSAANGGDSPPSSVVLVKPEQQHQDFAGMKSLSKTSSSISNPHTAVVNAASSTQFLPDMSNDVDSVPRRISMSDRSHTLRYTNSPPRILEKTSTSYIPSTGDGLSGKTSTTIEPDKDGPLHFASGITTLSERLVDYTRKWHDGSLKPDSVQRELFRSLSSMTTYILGCPKAHPLSYAELKKLIEHDRRRMGLEGLRNKKPEIEVDVRCPICDKNRSMKSRTQVKWARQIEPLLLIAADMQRAYGSGHHKNSASLPRTSLNQDSTTTISWLTNSMRNSRDIHTSWSGDSTVNINNSAALSGYKLHDRRHWADVLVKSSSDVRTQPSYCFFADNQSLLMWARDADHVLVYDIVSKCSQMLAAANVHLAAGGSNIVAATSKHGDREILSLYHVNYAAKLAEIVLDGPITSLAVSLNDAFVAVGNVGSVLVYHAWNTQISWQHEVASMTSSQFKNQRAYFSKESDMIMVATRDVSGNVLTYVSKCVAAPQDSANPTFKIATLGHKDFGLTSALHDPRTGQVLITAFNSGSPPALISFPEANSTRSPIIQRVESKTLGTQIQCATTCLHPSAESSSQFDFLLVNGDNHVLTVKIPSAPSIPCGVTRKWRLPGGPVYQWEEMTVIASPVYDIIYAFRIKGKERNLTIIKGDELSTSNIAQFLTF